MEKLYTHRYESVLAQLQPLIESGLDVRVVAGKVKVELPSDVLFASGSATLSRKGREEVQKVAGALRPFRTMLVQVEGHTDNVPVKSFKYESNYDLAFARAKDVMNVMLEAGLDADRVSAASFGDTRPVTDNDTRISRARNRRIELNLELVPEATP
jgi:chemotaxis protein MotB